MAVVQRSGQVELTVDTADFRALFARSSQVEPKLRTALRRRIRDAAKGVAAHAQAEALKPGETRSARPRSRGLRHGIASSVKVGILTGEARQGVRITANAPLAGAWQAKSWRHPIFGTRARAVQVGRPDYFYGTVWDGRDRVKDAVESAMREAVDSLNGGAS